MTTQISPSLPKRAPGAAMDRRVAPSRASKLRRWRLPAAGLVLAVLAYAGYQLVPASDTLSVDAASITTATVANAPFQDYLPVRGAVAPLHTEFVGAVEGGTVAQVMATEGATVKPGDVLATLSNPQLQLDVTSREAAIAGQLGSISAQRMALQQNLTAEETAMAETSYDLLKAQRELAIRQRLHDQDFESDAGLKTFQDEAHYYANRLNLLRQAHARNVPVAARQTDEIDQTAAGLRNNLAVVQASLQALILRAPVAGRLTNFSLQPGQSLKQGDQIGQIDSEDAYRLDADIDEFYLGRVSAGEHAVADFNGAQVKLEVARVKPQVANGQFRAELVFDGAPPAGLRRGESTDVRITLGATEKALVLPNGPWMEGSGGSFVYVLDAGGHHAERRDITTGRRNPEQVEMTAGLAPGDRVITSSYASFTRFTHLLIQ